MRTALLTTLLAITLLADVHPQQPSPPASRPAPNEPTSDPAELAARRADKLAAPFLRQAHWYTDRGAAERAAAREGKLVLVHFTRSFVPCGTSIRCERDVLQDPAFAELAARVVLYCHVTAHVDPAHDRALFAARGSGWPHHAVFDATGRLLGVHESFRPKSVADLAALVDRATDYVAAEAAFEREAADLARRRLEAGLAVGALDLAEARALAAAAGPMAAADAARIDGLLTDLEVATVLADVDRFDAAQHAAVGATFQAMVRAGKQPVGRNAVRDFWGGILAHIATSARPDLALYREGLARLEAMFGDERGYAGWLEARRQELSALEAAPGDGPPGR